MAYLKTAMPLCQALGDKVMEVDLLNQLGLEAERTGDYCRLLTEYQQKRLHVSREIGYRQGEGHALILCGQTQSIYLGDYDGGLALLEEARRVLARAPHEMFALLRIVQIRTMQGKIEEALEALEDARRVDERAVFPHGRAGLRLVSAILYNALGDEAHLHKALEFTAEARRMVADNPLLTRQYQISIAHESAVAHLGLAECAADETERQAHLRQALELSRAALDIYQQYSFVQIIECISEEILYRHSQTLAATGHEVEAAEYLRRAHAEMMRKYALIPPDSSFRHTYLENIPLHRNIRATYTASFNEEQSQTGSER